MTAYCNLKNHLPEFIAALIGGCLQTRHLACRQALAQRQHRGHLSSATVIAAVASVLGFRPVGGHIVLVGVKLGRYFPLPVVWKC